MRAPKGGVRREAKEDQIPTSCYHDPISDNSVLGELQALGSGQPFRLLQPLPPLSQVILLLCLP